MFDPGVAVRHSPPGRSWFAVGSIDPATRGRESEIADLLGHAGKVEIVDNIRAAKWMKLVSNATTLVSTSVLGLSIQDAIAIPGMRELMLQSGQEAFDTGKAVGYPTLPIFGLTPNDVRESNRLVETLLDHLVAGFTLKNTTSTVLQDWTKGRHSEVDDLSGLVAAEAARHGIRAPVNAALTELGHRIERGTLKPGLANLNLLKDMLRQ
jgi:2-dehydropantoate 2-reductase